MIPKSILNQIQQAAENALNSPSIDEGMKHLTNAFSLFSHESEKLEQAYQILQSRFQQVNAELEKSNEALRQKVIELNTLSTYLNNILKNISQGIIFVDTEGMITTFNLAAQEILEIESKECLFQSFWHLFSDDIFGFPMRHTLTFQLSHDLLYVNFMTKKETKKEIEISATFLHDAPKQYQGLILLVRDITNLRHLQTIVSRNERMKELGEIVATVAHEIRNPLGGIRGYASLLYRDLEDTKNLQEMASYILEGTKTLERLVNKVLQFCRPIYLQPKSIDLVLFLKETYKFMKMDPSFPKNIQIDLHLCKEPLLAPIDKELLGSALLNLFLNAQQAMEEKGGTLTISLIKTNQSGCITISDTGKGITQQDLEKIFTPFFTTKEDGTGLGLSETYKIIQAHFGRIDVRSNIGIGTTFTITLPLKR